MIGDAAAEITLDQTELLLKEKETAVLKASVAPQLDTSKPVEDVTVGLETEQSEIIQTNVNQIIESVVSGEETSQISTETKNNIEEALKDGSTIETKVLIELKEMEEIKQEDILKIESITGEKAVVAQYLNLEIKLMAGNKELGTIEEIREPMTFTIMIPEELKAEGRTFFVVRIHEGEAEKLPVNTNPDGTISFKTDKFSTYALAYEDKEKIENQESESDKGHLGSTDKPQENNENNTNQSDPVQQSSNPEYTESVKTGDPLNMMNVVGLIVLMAVALTLFIILMKKRMVKK